MKGKKIILPVILLGFVFSTALTSSIASAQKKDQKQEEKKAEEKKIIIPKDIQDILQQGLATRQGRPDIKSDIVKHLFLPGKEKIYSIFVFKMKNGDLGFMPPLVQPEEKKEGEKEQETAPTELQTALNIFLQFYGLEDDKPVKLLKEVYIPVFLQEEENTYDPEKEELYTINYLVPPGDYLLAMAITSLRTQKIGTTYYAFSLPDIFAPFPQLETTPVILARGIEQLSSPEITAEVHKNIFKWSILQVEPAMDNIVTPKDRFEVMFFIYGAQVNETGRPNLTITYEILKGEEKAIRFEPISWNSPFIEQPLQLKQVVSILQDGKEIRKETRDLQPGEYTLSINIKDNIGNKTITKTIPFTMM